MLCTVSLIFYEWDYSYSYNLVVINMIAVMNITSPLVFAIRDIIVINSNLNQNESKQKYLVQNAKFANSHNSNSIQRTRVHNQ